MADFVEDNGHKVILCVLTVSIGPVIPRDSTVTIEDCRALASAAILIYPTFVVC